MFRVTNKLYCIFFDGIDPTMASVVYPQVRYYLVSESYVFSMQ